MIGSPASRGAVASVGGAGRACLAAASAVSAVSAAIAASVTMGGGPQRRIAPVDCAGKLLDDVKFDLCNTPSNQSQRFGRSMRDVDNSSANERTAVIDPNCHGPPSSDVCHAQPGAEAGRIAAPALCKARRPWRLAISNAAVLGIVRSV